MSSEGSGINDITIIGRWPGPTRETDYVMKTPSRIAYVKDGNSSSKQLWGFQVEPGMKAYSWFKLLLDEYTPLTKYDDANLERASKSGILRLPNGKSATDVTADFLSEIYRCILKVLIKQITAEVLRITPLEFWFTVPAIWSDKAMNATLEAAHRAGFGKSRDRSHDTVNLIPEPEAAAITTLNKCIGKGVTASIEVTIPLSPSFEFHFYSLF